MEEKCIFYFKRGLYRHTVEINLWLGLPLPECLGVKWNEGAESLHNTQRLGVSLTCVQLQGYSSAESLMTMAMTVSVCSLH